MLIALSVLFTLFLIQHKHLVVDFLWQPPYEWRNKGTYGHLGGISHAGKNSLGTAACLYLGMPGVSVGFALWLGLIDFIVHYHIDWCKMNLNQRMGLCPEKPGFWHLLGTDQHLHQITYLALVWYALVVVYG
jgi:hypothetical protein